MSLTAGWRTVAVFCFLANVLCYIDRTNLSVAIIVLAEKFSWTLPQQGLLLASFFYGYITTQVVGGVASSRYGGERVLAFAVCAWSFCTLAFPFSVAHSIIPPMMLRVALGACEGLALPAIHDIASHTFPLSSRTSVMTTVAAGHHVGTVVAFLLSPLVAVWWEGVFFIFGGAGLAWAGLFGIAVLHPLSLSSRAVYKRVEDEVPPTSTTSSMAALTMLSANPPSVPAPSVRLNAARRGGAGSAGGAFAPPHPTASGHSQMYTPTRNPPGAASGVHASSNPPPTIPQTHAGTVGTHDTLNSLPPPPTAGIAQDGLRSLLSRGQCATPSAFQARHSSRSSGRGMDVAATPSHTHALLPRSPSVSAEVRASPAHLPTALPAHPPPLAQPWGHGGAPGTTSPPVFVHAPPPVTADSRILFTSAAIAIYAAHFGCAYGHHFALSWLPRFLVMQTGASVSAAGSLAVPPAVAAVAASVAAGVLSDRWIQRGVCAACGRRRGLCGCPGAGGPSLTGCELFGCGEGGRGGGPGGGGAVQAGGLSRGASEARQQTQAFASCRDGRADGPSHTPFQPPLRTPSASFAPIVTARRHEAARLASTSSSAQPPHLPSAIPSTYSATHPGPLVREVAPSPSPSSASSTHSLQDEYLQSSAAPSQPLLSTSSSRVPAQTSPQATSSVTRMARHQGGGKGAVPAFAGCATTGGVVLGQARGSDLITPTPVKGSGYVSVGKGWGGEWRGGGCDGAGDVEASSSRSRLRTARVAAQAIGSLGPAVVYGLVFVPLVVSGAAVSAQHWAILATAALGLASVAHSGYFVNVIDIAPGAAGTLFAVSNTIATMAGIVANSSTGFLLESSWKWIAPFLVVTCIYAITFCVFAAYAEGGPVTLRKGALWMGGDMVAPSGESGSSKGRRSSVSPPGTSSLMRNVQRVLPARFRKFAHSSTS